MKVLFSEGTNSSRINVLTKFTIETHLVLQGNATFRSSVYSPMLPLVPFSANIAYVTANHCPPNVIRVQIRQHLWRLSSYLVNNLAMSTLVICISVTSLEYLLVFQVTLSYGDPENKHNVVSVGGVFGLQQDPTRLVSTSKTRSPYHVHVCHL